MALRSAGGPAVAPVSPMPPGASPSEHAAAEIDRILARLAGELVHEAFDGEDVVVGADAAPEAGGHRGRLMPHILDPQIGNVVGDVHRAVDGVEIDIIGIGRRQPAGQGFTGTGQPFDCRGEIEIDRSENDDHRRYRRS